MPSVKIARIGVMAGAIACLVAAAAIRLNPSFLILFAHGVKIRSPYCSIWKASLDGHVKLQQQSAMAALVKASSIMRRQAGLTLWATPAGEYWVPGSDPDTVAVLLAQEARNIYGSGAWGVQQGEIVLDAGAYIGTWTKQALARGARLVVAIEPSPLSIECLKRNLADEIAAGRVIIYPKGIWDSEGALTLFGGASGIGNRFVENASAANVIGSIPVTTIDKLAAELRLGHVDFIKADVKGATERLLSGAAGVIRRDRPRLALSTEESVDDPASIAKRAMQIQPAYQMLCGACLLDQKTVYTDVLFFR
jgi:FkbM family methyltransferase